MRVSRRTFWIATFTLAALCGCEMKSYRHASHVQGKPESIAQAGLALQNLHDTHKKAELLDSTNSMHAGETTTDQPASADPTPLKRQIVYNAQVDLVVEKFSEVPQRLEALVKRFDALIAGSRVGAAAGTRRSGTWHVRVPAAGFDDFLKDVAELGEVRSVSRGSDDVTAEYYDVETRIANLEKEEKRLVELLADRTGKLEDVLAVEREISRVRGEIERAKGRMRVLNDLTALSTVDVSVEEIENYVPEEAAGLATRIRRNFAISLDALGTFGENVALAVVVATPWLATFVLPIGLVVLVGRRWVRRLRGTGAPPDARSP